MSASKMNHLHHQSLSQKEISEVAAVDQTYTNDQHRDRSVAGLVAHASKTLWEEHDRSANLAAFELPLVDFHDESKDWTRLAKFLFPNLHEWLDEGARVDRVFVIVPPDVDQTDTEWHNPTHVNFCKTVIPRFTRTRMVLHMTDEAGPVAICSCCRFSRSNLCCSHIYCVQGGRQPVTTDASHRYLTLFGLQYGRIDAATKAYHGMQDCPLVGPPCTDSMSITANPSSALRRHHVQPFCHPTIKVTNSYWDRNATRLERAMAGSILTWDSSPPFNFDYLPVDKLHSSNLSQEDAAEIPGGGSFELNSTQLSQNEDGK